MTKDSTAHRTGKGRRRFLGTLAGLGGAWAIAAIWPIYRFLAPQPKPDPFAEKGRAKVDKIGPADVASPNTGGNGSYAGRGVIVFRAPDGALRAFDSKCTHAGCNVAFEGDRLFCNCHGGVYDLEGQNVSGPPPRPLTALKAFEEDGVIYVGPKEGKA